MSPPCARGLTSRPTQLHGRSTRQAIGRLREKLGKPCWLCRDSRVGIRGSLVLGKTVGATARSINQNNRQTAIAPAHAPRRRAMLGETSHDPLAKGRCARRAPVAWSWLLAAAIVLGGVRTALAQSGPGNFLPATPAARPCRGGIGPWPQSASLPLLPPPGEVQLAAMQPPRITPPSVLPARACQTRHVELLAHDARAKRAATLRSAGHVGALSRGLG